MSSLEYGCSTTNKYSFLNENEDMEDPSDILAALTAQAAAAKEQALKDAKAGKTAAGKKDATGKTIAGKTTSAPLGKDGKKQPLQQQQQQSDNKTGGGFKTNDNLLTKDGRQQQNKPRSANMNGGERRSVNEGGEAQGKENTGGEFKQVREQQRRPRQEGGFEGGYRNNQDGGNRPPRRAPGENNRPAGDNQNMRPSHPARRVYPARDSNAPAGSGQDGGSDWQTNGEVRQQPHHNNNEGGNFSRGPRPMQGGPDRREGGVERFNRREGGNDGRREGGYNRGPRQSNDPEHRTFDRHSGGIGGIKAVDKKDGAGKSNWGTYNDEIVAERGDAATEQAAGGAEGAQQTGDWAARVDENDEKKDGDAKEGGAEPAEDVPNFLTLSEYKALQAEINKKNEFNTRRAGEGEDQAKWKNTYVLPKKPAEEGEEEEDDDEEEEEEEEDEEERKKKALLNQIQIKFYEPASKGRDDRGDRGDRAYGGERRDRGDRTDRPPRQFNDRPRRDQQQPTGDAAAPASGESTTAAPSGDATTTSPQKPQQQRRDGGDRDQQRRDDRGPRQFGGDRDQRQGGGERRGPPRGGDQQHQGPRNQQGPRGQAKNAPVISDEKDFPSLGAK